MSGDRGYQKACLRELDPLIGKNITDTVCDSDGNFGLAIDGGFVLWIMCDPEGNGPGFPQVDRS